MLTGGPFSVELGLLAGGDCPASTFLFSAKASFEPSFDNRDVVILCVGDTPEGISPFRAVTSTEELLPVSCLACDLFRPTALDVALLDLGVGACCCGGGPEDVCDGVALGNFELTSCPCREGCVCVEVAIPFISPQLELFWLFPRATISFDFFGLG